MEKTGLCETDFLDGDLHERRTFNRKAVNHFSQLYPPGFERRA